MLLFCAGLQTQAQAQRGGSWSSGLFDAHHDEETCASAACAFSCL
jgi:hypothetical protein